MITGEKLALTLYPRDKSPGCSSEMCSLRDSYQMLEETGITIYGISAGSAESHQEFREEYNLLFHLLVDGDLEIAEKYDARSRLGIIGFSVKRITYLIDEEGSIKVIFGREGGDVKTKEHAKQISQFWGFKS